MADLHDLQRQLARPTDSPPREQERPRDPPGGAADPSLENPLELALAQLAGDPEGPAGAAMELPPDPGSFELGAPVDFLDAALAAHGETAVEVQGLDPEAPVAAELELPPDPGALELAPPVDFLDAALAAGETEVEVDLEDVHLEAGRATADAPPPVPVHRFPDGRRDRAGKRGPSRTIGDQPRPAAAGAGAGIPPPPAWKESAVMRGPTRPTDRPAEPEPALTASGVAPTAGVDPARLEATPGPAPEPAPAESGGAPIPAAAADPDRLAAPPGPAPEPARGTAKPPAAPAPVPPPLPKGDPAECLALPGPAPDFELYAPAPVPEPEAPFTGTAGAWSAAVSGIRREPLARVVPVRPPPPVLPQVARAGVPPALTRVAPPDPTLAPPPSPAAAEIRDIVTPGPRVEAEPGPVDPDEPSFAPGPPSIAEDLYGGAIFQPRVEGERQVVVHTREGQALRGSLRDVELSGPILPLETRGGTLRVPVDRVRAVFFIVPIGDPLPEPQGRKARVVFEDGRPVAGLVEEYRHQAIGFFLMPLDGRGRTERIFVYRDAIRSIQFLD